MFHTKKTRLWAIKLRILTKPAPVLKYYEDGKVWRGCVGGWGRDLDEVVHIIR